MLVSFNHTVDFIDVFMIHSGKRATITKFVTEIETTALEFYKPITNSRLARCFIAKTSSKPSEALLRWYSHTVVNLAVGRIWAGSTGRITFIEYKCKVAGPTAAFSAVSQCCGWPTLSESLYCRQHQLILSPSPRGQQRLSDSAENASV
ncbi:hypothetical protein EVAR_24562_1 [Eumeta japonica]|uniref:Uncharacterized protein n=1 Tax=Eumeta variegata TaxID=151549 RepID=A0A4C1W7P1_EUMVA|nr:hypothetical protein EVAR_24562_1 [Eumeta japonica]